MTAQPRQPIGVVLILLNPSGQIVASADDFSPDRHEAHAHLQEAQQARAYRALCSRVINALATPALARAIDPASYGTIVDTMVRRDKCQIITHYVGQSAPIEGQHF